MKLEYMNFKYMKLKTLALYVPVFLALAVCACSRQPTSTADIPRLISSSYRIAVAPFSQPVSGGDLLSGQIPEDQGKIPEDALLALDMDLRDVLTKDTSRKYDFIMPKTSPHDLTSTHTTVQPSALPRWIEYGKKQDAQMLLVPQVLDWHEREGSQAGVTSSAHVRLEFFLINIDEGAVARRSVFEEKQVGLADNLLGVGDFFKRKGQWISARELAIEAMRQAVKDMGL